MKRIVLTTVFIIICLGYVQAGIMLEGTYGLYCFSDTNFKTMFGSTASICGLGIGYELNHFNFIVAGKYLNKIESGSSLSRGTDFKLIPVSMSVRYLVIKNKIQPFVGVGVTYNKYKKGTDSAIGFIAELGGYFRVAKRLYMNFLVKSNHLKFTPVGMDVKMRGISSEIGITFK